MNSPRAPMVEAGDGGTVAEPVRSLRLTEIFLSLQGEGTSVGWPTVFVRLTGCPLRCRYCDTRYAFSGGEAWGLEAILDEVAAQGVAHVCVSGGEPLAQPDCLPLLSRLCDAGYHVSLETSGALDIARVDPRVERVVDVKTPSSGEEARNHWANLEVLQPGDRLKFVIGDRGDYDWARELVAREGLDRRCTVLFSPVHEALAPQALADWIVADRLPVRFQIQLHKLLWGEEPGR